MNDKTLWPHTEMPIFGKTPSGHRIARQCDGKLRVLAPGQEAVECHYNGPSMAELNKMSESKRTPGTMEICCLCAKFCISLDRDNDSTNWSTCDVDGCPTP